MSRLVVFALILLLPLSILVTAISLWIPGGNSMTLAYIAGHPRDIHVVDTSRGLHTRLTSHPFDDIHPVWSPDGSQLGFISSRDGQPDFYIMDSDGRNIRRVTSSDTNREIRYATWSSRTTELAVMAFYGVSEEIRLLDLATGTSQIVIALDYGTRAGLPVWSPDGSQIAFDAAQVTGNRNVFIVERESLRGRNLTRSQNRDGTPDWSPNSQQIAFVSDRNGQPDIYIIAANGGRAVRLTDHPTLDTSPRWSPDGTQIAFVTRRSGNLDIFIMDANGGNPRNLSQDSQNETAPLWSPDGRYLAYQAVDNGITVLYTIRQDGNQRKQWTEIENNATAPAWRP
jgi:Tol biopolymer transport system component